VSQSNPDSVIKPPPCGAAVADEAARAPIATAAITDATLIRLNISILLSSLPNRAEQKPGPVTVPADDLRAPRRVEGVLEGGVLRPAVATDIG
jgi:hypothetical protein